nr:DNA adenine methylase [Verrucomicrobium spinosum]
MNLFRVVRDDGLRLREALRCTPFARAEFLGAWLPADSSFEQARRSVVRAYMGFGSGGVSESRPNGRVMTGFRSNTSRAYSTPASNWHSFPQALELIVERLRGVVIENREAVQVMSAHDERTTLHYVDPPYVGSARGDGCGEYRHEMTDEQHQELVNTFQGYRVSLLFPVTRQLCTMKYSKGGFVLSVGQWLTGRGLEPRFYG